MSNHDTPHLASEILREVRGQLGERYARLSEADRQLVADVAYDAASLIEASLAAAGDPAAKARVERERRVIEASVANLAAAAGEATRTAVFEGIGRVMERVARAVLGAATRVILP